MLRLQTIGTTKVVPPSPLR